MTKATEQRIVFILKDDGKSLNLECDFFPRLSLSAESLEELSQSQQNLQVIASNIGKIIMEGFKRTIDQETAAQEVSPVHDDAGQR